jgi:hypothetical protein
LGLASDVSRPSDSPEVLENPRDPDQYRVELIERSGK